MGCYYTLCHNTYAFSLLYYKVYTKRENVKEEEHGGSLPLASGGAGTPPGAIIITAIYTNTSIIFTNISITFPHQYSAVHSPATRCTLYLNMVLYASYYYQ